MKTVVITLLILLGLVTIIAWLTDRKKPTDKQVDDLLYKYPTEHRSCSSCAFADEPTDCQQCVACESYSNWSARS